MVDNTLEQLESQLNELIKVKVFDEKVAQGVETILSTMPSPEEEKDTERKVRLLLLRCKTRLLLPIASKDTEKDFNTALKLRQGSADTWVELAECLLRRNAFKEACDALDNALRMDPKNIAALCKYSQVQRNRCSEAGLTAAQRREFMADSVAKARAAVAVDIDDADSWNTLALSLLSQITSEGMTFDGVRRALAAMQQAARKVSEPDPDLFFNKGVLEGLIGHFGTASEDFMRAYQLDNKRLRGTSRMCETNVEVLRRANTRMKNVMSVGKKEFKRLCDSVVTAGKKLPTGATHLVVVDILSEPTMQPLTLLTANASGSFNLVLLFEVSTTAFKIGDTLSLPSSEAAVAVEHHVPAIAFLDVEPFSVSFQQYYSDPRKILLNGHPLPSNARVPLQMSSRLFA